MRLLKFIPSGTLAVMLPLFLVSCASSHIDSRHQQLAANAETNRSTNAIVGMWHSKYEGAAGGKRATYYLTILFRENGTGLTNNQIESASEINFKDDAVPLTWTYRGGGVWRMVSRHQGQRWEVRVSGDRLLVKDTRGKDRFVYKRISQ